MTLIIDTKYPELVPYEGTKQLTETQKFICAYLKANPCKHCGERDIRVLEFHHLRDKHFGLSRAKDKPLVDVVLEVEKCDVLCANCHRKVTHPYSYRDRYLED